MCLHLLHFSGPWKFSNCQVHFLHSMCLHLLHFYGPWNAQTVSTCLKQYVFTPASFLWALECSNCQGHDLHNMCLHMLHFSGLWNAQTVRYMSYTLHSMTSHWEKEVNMCYFYTFQNQRRVMHFFLFLLTSIQLYFLLHLGNT